MITSVRAPLAAQVTGALKRQLPAAPGNLGANDIKEFAFRSRRCRQKEASTWIRPPNSAVEQSPSISPLENRRVHRDRDERAHCNAAW